MPASIIIELTDEDRREFHRRCRSGKTAARVKERLSVVLLADEGLSNTEVAEHVPLSAHAIGRWRKRFSEEGLARIEKNKPRGLTMNPSKNAEYARLRQQIIEITTRKKPDGATHWSTRTLAAKLGTNHKFVSRVWRDNGLKPHLVKSFKVSDDPNFEEKLADVVGLYMNPPENTAVFCVDEKSSIQALDRTQPGLPMKKGRADTKAHDYKRNGTSTLFGAMVNSGVQAVESSGVLIDLLHFNSVVEFETGDDLGQVIKTSQPVPAHLGTQSKLEHHMQHRVT